MLEQRLTYLVLPGVLGLLGLLGLLGVVVLLLPLVLGEVVLLLPLPEPMPLELGVLELELLPPVAPLPLPLVEESVLKCASHSEREICPSLFVSTIEKVGAELLAPLEALPPLDMLEDPEEPEALEESVALGALSALEPVDEDPELWAMDTLAIAKSAAAVAVPTSFNIWTNLLQG